jgi:hypothetical protein
MMMRLVGLVQCHQVGRCHVYRIASAHPADLVERCFSVAAGRLWKLRASRSPSSGGGAL